jgi:hypothetical protein
MADNSEDPVLEMLRRLDAKVDRVMGYQTAMRAEHRSQFRILSTLVRGRLLYATSNDIANENGTTGKTEAVWDDLARLARKVDGVTSHLEMIEELQKDN